jgi:rhamnogalacturonan endolyase
MIFRWCSQQPKWIRASPTIFKKKIGEYTDVVFSADEGHIHWVLTPTLSGAYQYFVNRALPTLGEVRTLWRLDNSTVTHGYTSERDEALVPLNDIRASGATKV